MANPTLPASEEYERVLLSTLLSNNATYYKISTLVTPKDFYSLIRAEILTICGKLIAKDSPIDPITILETFSESETKFDRKALEDEINAILETVGVESSIDFYGQEVKRLAIRRRLYQKSIKIANKYLDREIDYEDTSAEMFTTIGSVGAVKGQNQLLNVKEFTGDYYEILQKRRAIGANGIIGLRTGFIDLDLVLGGMRPVQFIIMAARPGVGKSTWSQNVIENITLNTEKTCLLFSLESSKEEIMDRFAASLSNVDSRKIRVGNLNSKDWFMIRDGMNKMSNFNVLIDDEPIRTADEILMLAHLCQQKYDLGLVVIDYLQLIKPDYRKGMSRAEQVAEISRKMKIMTKQLKVPVIALAQLNREVEKRVNRMPMLSDLKETGSLEQDADVCLFLHRKEMYAPDPDCIGMADLIVGKHRDGGLGTLKLRFFADKCKFVTRFSNDDIPQKSEDLEEIEVGEQSPF